MESVCEMFSIHFLVISCRNLVWILHLQHSQFGHSVAKLDRHLWLHACVVTSVVPSSLWHHGPQPTRFFCPWDFPVKNTGVGCHALFQGTFQGLNLCLLHLLHCRWILYSWATGEAQHLWLVSNILESIVMEIKIYIYLFYFLQE